MAISTWHSITNGLHAATYKSYMAKSSRQRKKHEVVDVMADVDGFVERKKTELKEGVYRVGKYRHFVLCDKKKARQISVLPYEDRCVQNDIKAAFEPMILHQMTDDMMGGLPGRGVMAKDQRHSVVEQVRRSMNDLSLKYWLQCDIIKCYDSIDNVTSIRLIERKVSDKRTLALIRQHLFNQKKLAIGDPFSHLIANTNMSVIIRKAKKKYGNSIRLINFADDILVFGKERQVLVQLRQDLRKWAKEIRLHFKRMYIRPITKEPITFCGNKFGRGYVKLTKITKKRYIMSRHRRLSMGSYNGLLQVADTKRLRYLIETKDNRTMNSENKIRRPFAGRPMKIEAMEGITHTIVDMAEKNSRQKDSDSYMHVQAIAEGLGLVVYSTGSAKICEYLKSKSKHDIPIRDMVIVHDWSGFYYEGTVYTDAEEEEMIRKQFNI